LLLALVGVEAAVRVFRPQVLHSVASAPLLRGRLTQPGSHRVRTAEFDVSVQVNEHGFVDRPWGPRRPGVPRVVVLGDSFVEAAQVTMDQGFGRRLEAAMSARGGEPVEVLSMGVPGAGTSTALGLLETYALPREPDLVLLGFLVSNDVLNNHPLLEPKGDKPFHRLDGGRLLSTDAASTMASAWQVRPLWSVSHAWRLLARGLVARQLSRDRLERGGGMPIDLRVHDPAGGPIWEEAWAVTEALIAAMAQRCSSQGVAFATLIFPSQIEASPAGRAAALEAWPAMESWDLQAAARRVESVAAVHAPVLDLTPALAAAAEDGEPLYSPQDGHWTARGHEAAAAATAPFALEALGH
jgi:hypothetical protein